MNDLIEVGHTDTEAEAMMYKELLKQQGIVADVHLPRSQGLLRSNAAGGANPYDVWLILVPANDVEMAKKILPSLKHGHRKLNKPQKLYRWWTILILAIFLIILIYSFVDMIKYIFAQ